MKKAQADVFWGRIGRKENKVSVKDTMRLGRLCFSWPETEQCETSTWDKQRVARVSRGDDADRLRNIRVDTLRLGDFRG